MKYTQLTDDQIQSMLSAIGADSIDTLFDKIPEELRCKGLLDIPRGVSELEILKDLDSLAKRNHDCTELTCFLGGGAYDHFIPTVVDALAGQSELLTAYTPYQAEASQGILQLFFEFQTMVCELTGMEVANASLYEVSSAVAEAVIMACHITKRSRVVVCDNIHPDTTHTLKTYCRERSIELVELPHEKGVIAESRLVESLNDNTAAVVIQSPNYFGCVESLDKLVPAIHNGKALAIVATDPMASGILKPPGDFDVDIVVAEGQALGIPLQYGGPYLGLMAGREKHLRKLPGRVVGMTADKDGKRGFCLAVQTREQHIKRDRATSNICTNQGLLATRASIYMSAMGRIGLAEVAKQCFDKAHYAADQIEQLEGFSLRFDAPFFKEFTVRCDRNIKSLLEKCREKGILAGLPLVRFDERYSDSFLVAVTEKRTKNEIDSLVAALKEA